MRPLCRTDVARLPLGTTRLALHNLETHPTGNNCRICLSFLDIRLSLSKAHSMTRQRKAKTPNAVPETSPSKMPPRPATDEPLIQISEEEQWRIINESGILKSTALQDTTSSDVLGERLSFSDELFNAVLLIIPFSSLLLLLEMYGHLELCF